MLSLTCQKLIEVRVRQLIWRRVQEALEGGGGKRRKERQHSMCVCVCVCVLGGAVHLGIMPTFSCQGTERNKQVWQNRHRQRYPGRGENREQRLGSCNSVNPTYGNKAPMGPATCPDVAELGPKAAHRGRVHRPCS